MMKKSRNKNNQVWYDPEMDQFLVVSIQLTKLAMILRKSHSCVYLGEL